MPGEVSDFLFAMCCERANRNELRLDAGQNGVDHLVAVGDLKHDAVERFGAQSQKTRGETIGNLIEPGVGHLPLWSGERQPPGIPCQRRAHRLGERSGGENVVFNEARKARRRRVDDARNRRVHANSYCVPVHRVLPQHLVAQCAALTAAQASFTAFDTDVQ